MLIALDTHVHLYDCYDLNTAFSSAFENFNRAAPQAALIGICLAERRGQTVFEELKSGARTTADLFHLERSADGELLEVSQIRGTKKLFIIPGRQIVTRERIEVLGLFLKQEIPDGIPAREVLDVIRDHGAVPVLSWAPGKWLLSRGRIVRALIEGSGQSMLLVGDTSLRPPCWLQPLNHRAALRRGLPLIYGSDPLPFAGEEQLIGSYATLLEGAFNEERPFQSLLTAVSRPPAAPRPAGRRSSLLSVLKRLRANQRVRADSAG